MIPGYIFVGIPPHNIGGILFILGGIIIILTIVGGIIYGLYVAQKKYKIFRKLESN
ncbi:MAG: hypothetical protein KGD58_08135 [Candidatus Lokiarchaeota archaeon]|nr:hypothetical protein [Candidatus Lokiarchaeota archaeon]